MPGQRGSGSLARRVEQVCAHPADDRELRLAALRAIGEEIPFDAYVWVLTDPETCVGSAPVARTPDLSEVPALVRWKYLTDVNRWTGLGDRFASLADVTQGELSRSHLWRHVLQRHGVIDVASAVLRDRFGCWAFLDLWRTAALGPFTATELERLDELLPALTAAIRGLHATAFAAGEREPHTRVGPVVLLLTDGLDVVAGTDAADAQLRELLPTPQDRAPVPACAYNVAAQFLATEAGVDHHPPRARLRTAGRLLTLRAGRLDTRDHETQQIVVTIEPSSGPEHLDLFSRSHGLTQRETELLVHIDAGRDTNEIADTMCLSPHTVQDHCKAVFAKTNVRSRRDLLGRARGR